MKTWHQVLIGVVAVGCLSALIISSTIPRTPYDRLIAAGIAEGRLEAGGSPTTWDRIIGRIHRQPPLDYYESVHDNERLRLLAAGMLVSTNVVLPSIISADDAVEKIRTANRAGHIFELVYRKTGHSVSLTCSPADVSLFTDALTKP